MVVNSIIQASANIQVCKDDVSSKQAKLNRRKKKQFHKDGQKQMTASHSKTLIVLYKDGLKMEKRRTSQYK